MKNANTAKRGPRGGRTVTGNGHSNATKLGTTGTLSLLAGAGIGVAAMYFLDPQNGRRRRQQIAATARETAMAAGEAISPVISSAARSAADMGRNLATEGEQLASRTAEAISDRAGTMREHISEHGRDIWHRGMRRIGLEREKDHGFPVATTAAGALGLLAVGAGVAWMFDPARGAYRRHWLRDKSVSLLRDVGDLSCKTGRHVANHLYGAMARTRHMFQPDRANDAQLEARVRSVLGHAIPEVSKLRVVARNGCVTLNGTIAQDRIESAEAAVRAVRGVWGVDWQLQEQAPPA